jgi:hypothetical protein
MGVIRLYFDSAPFALSKGKTETGAIGLLRNGGRVCEGLKGRTW